MLGVVRGAFLSVLSVLSRPKTATATVRCALLAMKLHIALLALIVVSLMAAAYASEALKGVKISGTPLISAVSCFYC